MIVEKNFKASRRLTPADILPLNACNRACEEKRRTISAMKKNPIMCISTRHVMGFAIARRRRA
jgi:hypothetical protein